MVLVQAGVVEWLPHCKEINSVVEFSDVNEKKSNKRGPKSIQLWGE
jgi:hypothetical protein